MSWMPIPVVLLVLSPGCVLFNGCDLVYESEVDFEDETLYRDLIKSTPSGWSMIPGSYYGLPFRPETVNASWTEYARWSHYEFLDAYGPPTGLAPPPMPDNATSSLPSSRFTLNLDGRVRLAVAANVTAAEIRPWAEQFLANVSTLDRPARDAWTEAFLAVPHTISRERVLRDGVWQDSNVTGYGSWLYSPLAIERLWTRLGLDQVSPDGRKPWVSYAQDGWELTFVAGPILLRHTNSNATLRATVGYGYVAGGGSFQGDWPPEGISAQAALAEFNATYATLGRPLPPAQYRPARQC